MDYLDLVISFISNNPYLVGGIVTAFVGTIVYYWPRTEYGPEYTREGKIKETHHENDHSYTSTGTTFVNGSVGVTTQYHSIPEEFDVAVRSENDTFFVNDKKLYDLVDQGDKVSCVFKNKWLVYRSGKREPNGKSLVAVVKDGQRVEV